MRQGQSMKQVDFLPEDYVERKAQQRTNIICLSLFLVVLAGVGGGFVVTENRQDRIDARTLQINKEMQQASENLRQLEVLEGKRQEMMQKATISASLMEPVPRSLLLATITNGLPAGVSLRAVTLTSKDSTGKAKAASTVRTDPRNKKAAALRSVGKKPGDAEQPAVEPQRWETAIEVRGLAPTDLEVAELVRRLNASTLFRDVTPVFSEEEKVQEESLRHFKLMVLLNPEARASEQDVEMARQKTVSGM